MSSDTSVGPAAPAVETAQGGLTIVLAGDWTLESVLPGREQTLRELDSAAGPLGFESGDLGAWDSRLMVFLVEIDRRARQRGLQLETAGLPAGARRLLALAGAVPERSGARRSSEQLAPLARLGALARGALADALDYLAFLGETCRALGRLLTGRARMRRGDLLHVIQRTGPEALLIVCLISGLVGLILAFVAAVQLALFGAQIYVASLVGIAMVRVMGAVMTGVIMAGRTGAAFAAEIGSMQANEEVDALRTLGVSPVEFLVLPRVIGLTLMMPLLCLFADLMGILGGALVAIVALGLNPSLYYDTTLNAVEIKEVWIGLLHAFTFGVLVALTGCKQGMRAGRSAASVGSATTSAVVHGIVSIVIATAIITILCDIIGI